MADKKQDSIKFEELRNKAEKILQDREFDSSDYPSDLFELMEELRVYQAELEIQNEELKNAQQEMSELRREYEALYEFAPCGYLTLSPKGIITMCNLNGAGLLGVARGNLKSMTLSRFVTRDSQNSYFRAFREARPSGEQQNTELELARHDGQTVWVQANIQPDQNEEGSIEQWRITLTDITLRKQAEEAIDNERAYLSAVIDNIGEAIVICDAEGRIARFNETARRLHGLPEEPIPSDQWAEHFDLYQVDRITPLTMEDVPLFRALQGERVLNAEIVVAPKHSRPYNLVCSGQALTDESGKITGAVVAMHDITERKRMEKRLRHERDLSQRYLDTTQTIMVALNVEGQVTMINRSGRELLGYTEDEILGCNWFETFLPHPEGMDSVYPVFRSIMAGDLPSVEYFENNIVCRDGTQRLMAWHNAILEDDGGRVVGTLGSGEDITEHRQAEEALWESEQQFRILFEESPVSITIHAKDNGEIIDANPKAYTSYGLSSVEELKSRGMFMEPPYSHVEALEWIRKTVTEGPQQFEWLNRDIYGEFFWEQVRLIPITVNGVERIMATTIDITELKETMNSLRQSENYYRAIFETSSTALFIVEEDTTITLVNSNFEELLGYSKHELEGKKLWTEFVHPDDVEWMKENHYLRRHNPNAAPHQYEFRFLTRNSDVRYGYLAIAIIHDTTQSVVSLLDITDSKKADERIRSAHNKLDTLVQLNADGLMVLDPEGRILFLNPAAAEMLGREQDELLGEQFGHPIIPGSNTEIELLSTSEETRIVELRGRETEWSGQTALLVSFRDMTERKRVEERIYHLAYYDELTDLPNRKLFYDRLKQITSRTEHFDNGGVVFLVDITRLKEVNDTLGQQAGDELIQEVARRLRDTVHEEDTVARISGGEFKILSEGLGADDRARNLGLHILQGIVQQLELSGRLIYPEVKIGFTLFPQRGTDPDTLIKQTSMALSEAKNSTSRIQEFAGQEDWIAKQFHLEHDLKQALVNKEFFLCYQSQIDLRSGRIVGLEALIRWNHPERGIISPVEFIPVLEHTGMIASVDEWVIHRACKQLKSWQANDIFVKASVNLSAQELGNDATLEVIRTALEENGVRAENLEVEVTETSLMENVDQASRILQTLSSWGVRIALDDFGKGYSSLSYLQQLAINTIKIDKQFVDGLPENKDSVTLVQTIIAMAHNLGKEVLAEGVEREEQRQKLLELGCDNGQGFLWSRPQPVENLPFMGN